MNKGKENYNNIPLPDGLSDAIRTGLDRGQKYTTKKWLTGFGSLAAACLCLVVITRIFPITNGAAGNNSPIPSPANSSDTPVTPQAFSDERAVEVQEPASGMSGESPAGGVSQNTASLPETATPSSIRVYGTVTEINGSQVTISNDNQEDPYSTIVLNITEETLILTAEDCKEKTLKDLQEGDILYAYVSPIMTRSLPPISNAELILCQIPADMMVPTYAAITEVSSDPDGSFSITTDQELVCYINEDTVIKSLDGKTDLDSSALRPGTKILVWYQIATLSIPAQTNPDEIRVLP